MEISRYPNRLKKYRRMAGYSQKRVTRLLGFRDTSTLSRWEHGISSPSILQTLKLSRIYNTLPHELYCELWSNVLAEGNLSTHEESITR